MIQKILRLIELDPLGWKIGCILGEAVYGENVEIHFHLEKSIRIGSFEVDLTDDETETLHNAFSDLAEEQIEQSLDDILEEMEPEVPDSWFRISDGVICAGDLLWSGEKFIEAIASVGKKIIEVEFVIRRDYVIPEGWFRVPDYNTIKGGDQCLLDGEWKPAANLVGSNVRGLLIIREEETDDTENTKTN